MEKIAGVKSILVVCMGNICRSTTAEAVLREKLKQSKLKIKVDSAGTTGYHKGDKPDPRAIRIAEEKGYKFKGIRSRKVADKDFVKCDLILASDKKNLAYLEKHCPAEHAHKLALFLPVGGVEREEIPDPYYGSVQGFKQVLEMIEQASDTIIERLKV
ncbi:MULTISPECIES: low molecular weight protein-tyrosine-phosphatase [unclassified Agarivorans]|uniref:low molecular weight protein-tyrosine-phosphatase n=1 Tax=unclassified Agarivorans TaxID=2636026 RepID=UPI0010DDF3E4|nr:MULTISPECIES: low molecular weight protein-tyrosine-phosphatase [unclassified Agarivorans]MDO6686015.1 low molecular weight protein-tyrosine-phosphatase [Agarivorans sp. 3_MG-2023]MDO6713847.1 low molecular weight protein-tyrosine-phosphatase [Agarivorans sp. 2_MG-2023]MDO6762179.1 low molecular weight protein-tyrosine-phosphatase [Agarivorans sp. 1_MG-2023]GDY25712.1 protein-tyrosine-phosphatase [Agarivorans sp. Toyoura001]